MTLEPGRLEEIRTSFETGNPWEILIADGAELLVHIEEQDAKISRSFDYVRQLEADLANVRDVLDAKMFRVDEWDGVPNLQDTYGAMDLTLEQADTFKRLLSPQQLSEPTTMGISPDV